MKLNKLLIAFSAGVFALASCQELEPVSVNPAASSAPVMTQFTVENGTITVYYQPAEMVVGDKPVNDKLVYHTLAVVKVKSAQGEREVSAKVESEEKKADRIIIAESKAVTNALLGLGYAYGDQLDLELVVRAQLSSTATNGFIDSQGKMDLKGLVLEKPVPGGLDPYAGWEASTWGVTGAISSAGISWDSDIEMFTDGTWHVAKSVVLSASDQFKFRKDGGWETNFGAGPDITEEPYVVTLDTEQPAGPGGKNLAVPADGTYDLLLNPEAQLYKVIVSSSGSGGGLPDIDLSQYQTIEGMAGADVWALIGPAVSDWSTDVDLEKISDDPEIWSGKNIPFQADEFKFRGNHEWAQWDLGGAEFALNSPIQMAKGGNVTGTQAGSYTVYLYPTYGIAYITEAGGDTPPPPEKPKAWSLIGTLDGSNWDKDFDLDNTSGNTWVIKNVFVGENDEFKIRADHAWNKSFGGPEENAQSTLDESNPYGVYEPVIGETFTAGGTNIRIGVEGHYNVTLNYGNETSTILIEEYREFPEHVYMIGQDFGGWDWSSDGVVELVPVVHQPAWGAEAEGQFWTVKYLLAGSDHGFKFCSKREWSGDFWGLDENDGFVEQGGNCTVEADGNYLIHIDFKNSKVHIEPARVYGIGGCFGGWDENMESALFQADGQKLKITVPAAGELRMYVASEIATSGWWTREFIFFEDGVIDYRGDDEGQGDQARVNVLADQVVVLDFNAGTGAIEGEGQEPEPPKAVYMIGQQFGGWDWNSDGIVELVPVWGTESEFWCTRWFDHNLGFKFNSVRDWNGTDFTGDGEVGYTVSEDKNCFVPEDGIFTVYVNVAEKKVEIFKAEVYGIGDAWGADAWDFDKPDAVLFEEHDGKMIATVVNDSPALRLSTKVQPTGMEHWFDWWKTEYIFFDDCQIQYRGLGDDQARMPVSAGQTIEIDFNAGIATIDGAMPPAGDIAIDGAFEDWNVIKGGLSSEEGPYLSFKATNDDNYLFLYSKRTWHDGLWKESSGGYYYFEFDTDNNPATGSTDVNGNTGYGVEYWMYLYLFTGSKEEPTFASQPAGAGYPSDDILANVVAAGATDKNVIETEVQIPLKDLGLTKGQTIRIYSWGNKSAGNLKGEDSYLTVTIK